MATTGEPIPDLLADEEEEIHDEEVEVYKNPLNVDQQLEEFRQQWQQELKNNYAVTAGEQNKGDVEKEATALFLMGSKLEQEGSLYEAVSFYRRAMQLVPDIDLRIQYTSRSPRERQESESSVDSFDGEDLESDLITRFGNLRVDEGKWCSPKFEQRACHISSLPLEVVLYILKWVVSSQLDMKSLENVSQVCRGFYLCARDEELWRLSCNRVWGNNTGKVKKYGTWRKMFVERPHLQFVGCYISKMSYYREGEKSLDTFYSPWHTVTYYRYIRFFSEGTMLMLTSPEDPELSLPKLKYPHLKVSGMLKGTYRLTGNRVTAMLQRVKQPETTSFYRSKRNKNQILQTESQQHFSLELDIQNVGKRNGCKLVWISYGVRSYSRLTGEDLTEFEINNKNYPPMVFSRVKSYSTAVDTPLKL